MGYPFDRKSAVSVSTVTGPDGKREEVINNAETLSQFLSLGTNMKVIEVAIKHDDKEPPLPSKSSGIGK